MIEWVFLDVGNILLDEDPLTFHNFRVHVEAVRAVRPDLTFASLLADRERLARSGSRWPTYEAISPYLDEAGCLLAWQRSEQEIRADYDRLSPPVQGAAGLIHDLAGRFRLGLIANQGPECRLRLESLGWLNPFAVVALSEEEGRHKPDPELFLLALGRAGVEPTRAAMVGDRLDNDVEPALKLGMATVWVRWPDRAAKGWRPVDVEGRAYLRSLERSAPSLAEGEGPTRSVDDLEGVLPALLELG